MSASEKGYVPGPTQGIQKRVFPTILSGKYDYETTTVHFGVLTVAVKSYIANLSNMHNTRC